MLNFLPILTSLVLLAGLLVAVAALPYRTAEYRALPWHRQFVPRWKVDAYYRPPGPTLASLSSSLLALGGILLLITLAVK